MTATRERLCSSISPLRIPLDSELPCFVSGVCTVSNEVMNHAYNHRVRAECCDVHPRKGVAYGQGRLDRNAFIRKTLCELFTRDADFEVCGEAENGREAIEKAQELRPDLIVLDLSMPVMNGLDAETHNAYSSVDYIQCFWRFFREAKYAQSLGISELVSKSEHASVLIDRARNLLYPAA